MNSQAAVLMGDLESIKALLEEDLPPVAASVALPASVPAEPPAKADAELRATVASAELSVVQEFTLDATAPKLPEAVVHYSSESTPQRPLHAPLQPLEPFALDAAFHAATDAALARARQSIQEHATRWSPQQTDELGAALKVRIDDAVHSWVEQALAAHRHELGERILSAVRGELAHHLDALSGADATRDG